MENLLEAKITYTENSESFLSFCIVYPGSEEEYLKKIKELENKVLALTNRLKESEFKSSEKDIRIKDLSSKLSNFSFELDEKKVEISSLTEDLKSFQSQVSSLQNDLSSMTQEKDKKSNLCAKLQKALNDLKNNRKSAEVLLEKQEAMNKDLIEKNVKLEKILQDSEKKNQESSKIIQKLKEEISSTHENSKQRDEQIKSILKKIKTLENEKGKLLEELKKKDETMRKTFENPQNNYETVVERPREVRDAKKFIEIINNKDSEIKMMKDMIKSFQIKQQKPSNVSIGKNVKLPPIVGEKSSKKPEKSIRFREPSKNSLASVNKTEPKLKRAPTPLNPRKNFNSLFEKNEDTENNSQNNPENNSPNFELDRQEEQIEGRVNKDEEFQVEQKINKDEELQVEQMINKDEELQVEQMINKDEEFLETYKKKSDYDYNEKYEDDFADQEITETKIRDTEKEAEDNVRIETEKSEDHNIIHGVPIRTDGTAARSEIEEVQEPRFEENEEPSLIKEEDL